MLARLLNLRRHREVLSAAVKGLLPKFEKIRSTYALWTDQPTQGATMGPLARPVRASPTALVLFLALASAVGAGLLVPGHKSLLVATMMGAAVLFTSLTRPKVLFCFLLFSAAVPLNSLTGSRGSVLGSTTVTGAVLVVSVACMLLVFLTQGQLVAGFRLFFIPATWVLFSIGTLFYTDWLDEGMRLALKLLYPLLMGTLAYMVCSKPKGLSDMRRWWYLGYGAATVAAIVRLVASGIESYAAGEVYRYKGLSHPSTFSFYVLVTFIFALAVYLRKNKRLDGLVMMTAAVQVILTQTRIAIGSLVVAIAVTSMLAGRNLRNKLAGVVAAFALAVGLLAALVAYPILQGGVFHEPVGSIREAITGEGRLNTQGRDVLWGTVVNEYRRGNELLGSGLGSSTRLLGTVDTAGSAKVVHGEYVRILYEEGSLGVSWFVAMLLASALYLGRRLWRTSGMERALLSAGLVALLTYAILSITDNMLDYYHYFGQYVTVLVGAGLALRARRLQEPDEESVS